jgi:predicted secreted protein
MYTRDQHFFRDFPYSALTVQLRLCDKGVFGMPFSDSRGNRVVFVCHCLLNANAKVDGLARYAACHASVMQALTESGCGLVQLPCPEFLHMGPRRWWQSKGQYDTPAYRRHCAALAEAVVDQAVMYASAGVEIVGLLGVEGSPCCGVRQIYDHPDWGGRPCEPDVAAAKRSGRGIWIDELLACFGRRGCAAPALYGVGNEAEERTTPHALRAFLGCDR